MGTGATITTSGDGSDAISVKSIGGSGGSGGYSLAGGGVAIGLEVDVAVGSIGGTAGDGGAVSVTSNGALSTAGEHASGVEAKSAGGGGGDASLVVSGSALSLGDSGVAVGKSGQAGGNGGEVAVIAGESIATQGAASFGIEAQSLGGSGGSGSVTVAADAVSVVKLTVATRGGGGDGGVGGDVTVDSSADISTMGERADAVSAQSLGGSGGGSGVVISASVVSAAALNVAAGGAADDTDPGDAGNSGDVKVTQTGKITTEGEQANGILAQSIAGTGGNAEATISANVVSLGTLDVGVGGSGGAAGTSGSVDVVNQGSVTTLGAYADAIRALSVGGDGGQGSAAVNSTGASIVSASFAVGGSGGDGGQAGDVAVTNEGALTVAGNYGAAITAQSQGGNGGSGGLSVSAGISFNPDPAFPAGSVDLSFGGSGGDGGTAGEVQVTNAAGIVNEGSQGFGINALSLGGSGGTGGNSYTGSIDVASEVSINVAVSVGGSGGDGSVGNAVSVENSGSILTTNFMTPAIHAQSLGGSGGSGGGAYALYGLMDVLNLEADFAIELATVVGGAGGTGMDGGAVSVANGGLIETKQGGSHGIYAASTGGGGGSGGLAAALALDLEFKKKEDVPDEPSDGEDAENTVGSINFVASVGGSGGAAGDGDSVDVVNNAAILTEGQEAVGIKALSTGGGGGSGGIVSNKALFVNALCSQPLVKNVKKLNCKDPDDPTQEVLLEFDLKVAVGGSGGASGSGGTVTVDNAGAITTLGPSSPAISAFSTGGGGGSGGSSQTSLEPWIPLDDALALDAAVNGGDGGIFKSLTDYSTVEVFVGGSGGAQGDGGEIDITNTEILVTEGDQSNAIEAFSTGGGGGSFGQGGSGILSRAVLPNKWAVGGRGSGGGDGGDIVIRNEGTIVTSGEDSVGIFAQSTGGGGGAAGDVQGLWNLELVKLNFGAGIGIQLDSGDGGDGGDITVVSDGDIITTGETAHGIQVLSVGGSGGQSSVSEFGIEEPSGLSDGNVGITGITTFVGSSGDTGDSGDITVDVNGDIAVAGSGSIGVIAGSVAGVAAIDRSGDIIVTVNGSVSATGEDGRAILLGGSAAKNQGAIALTVEEGGLVESAEGARETVALLGTENGSKGNITNRGTLRAAEESDDEANYVLRSNGLIPTIDNYGLLSGSMEVTVEVPTVLAILGTQINNMPGGIFELGEDVSLGGLSFINNNGLLTAGEQGEIDDSAVAVVFLQQFEEGTLQVDLNFGNSVSSPSADKIELSLPDTPIFVGVGVTLKGKVFPNPVGLNFPTSGTSGKFSIVANDASTQASYTISDLSVDDTAIVNYELALAEDDGAKAVELAYEINYAPWDGFALGTYDQAEAASKASGNVRRFARHFSDVIVLSEDSAAEQAWISDVVNHVLALQDVGGLIDTYDAFIPDVQAAPLDTTLFSSIAFADLLQSCAAFGEDGVASLSHEGSCLWVRAGGSFLDRQASSDSVDYEESAFDLALGGQVEISEGLFAELGFAYEDTTLSSSGLSQNGDGYRFLGGAVLKQEFGRNTFSGSLSGGVNKVDIARPISTPGRGTLIAESSPSLNFVSAHARLARDFYHGDWTFTPTFDGGVEFQWQRGFDESGAGEYGMRFNDYNHTFGTLNPFLEVVKELQFEGLFGEGVSGQVYGRAGVLGIVGGNDRSLTAGFIGVPDSAGLSFDVVDAVAPISGDLGLGVELAGDENWSLQLEGRALLAQDQQSYGGSLKASLRF